MLKSKYTVQLVDVYGTNPLKGTVEENGYDCGNYESKEESLIGQNIPGEGRERMLCAAQYLVAAIKASNQVQFARKMR